MVEKSLVRRDKVVSHSGVEHVLRYWQQIWVHRGPPDKFFGIDSRLDDLFINIFRLYDDMFFTSSHCNIFVDVIQKEVVTGVIFITYLALRAGEAEEPVE